MDCLINPRRERGEAEISGTVLLCPNPGEALSLGRLAREQGWPRRALYNSTLWCHPTGGGALGGPAVGAPMAVMTLEKLIALGGQRFVLFGSCGGLAPELAISDIFLPAWAVSQEGTSGHYPLPSPPRPSAPLLGELTALLKRTGMTPHCGGVWTTDAPYRERRVTLQHYQAQGVAAVDMEFSALIQVAAFRQVELAAVLVVSDLLGGEVWQPGFRSRPFKATINAVGQALFNELAVGQL